MRSAGSRAYWLRIAGYFVAAQILGYLAALELHGRYPQDGCFFVVYCAFIAADEVVARLRRRRVLVAARAARKL